MPQTKLVTWDAERHGIRDVITSNLTPRWILSTKSQALFKNNALVIGSGQVWKKVFRFFQILNFRLFDYIKLNSKQINKLKEIKF